MRAVLALLLALLAGWAAAARIVIDASDDPESRLEIRTVTLPGASPRSFPGLGYPGLKLQRLEWLGFVSLAQQKTVLYLDNIKLDR